MEVSFSLEPSHILIVASPKKFQSLIAILGNFPLAPRLMLCVVLTNNRDGMFILLVLEVLNL